MHPLSYVPAYFADVARNGEEIMLLDRIVQITRARRTRTRQTPVSR